MPLTNNQNACGLAALGLCIVSVTAAAQATRNADAFRNRPLRFLIPFAAAGSNDVVARILAHQLTDLWNQQVVADNRAGANGEREQ